MRSDLAMKFFNESRNFSQKQGRVSLVGTGGLLAAGEKLMNYQFAQYQDSVPEQLSWSRCYQMLRRTLG